MPEISRFFGIVILMYYREHIPPHFHVRYNDQHATVSIDSGKVLDGQLTGRVQRLVLEWLEIHREEMAENWKRATTRAPLKAISPLE